jgi:hypothetical protein
MIPQQYITEWSEFAPWTANEQVEQDLIICRSLVELFSDEIIAEKLAFGEVRLYINFFWNHKPDIRKI